MRKQDYVVELIQALSANEKRYFKLYSNLQPGEKRYLNLFEALENKNKYDSAELCKQLNITTKQLTDDKAYLTQVLLQSLRNYSVDEREISALRNNRENAYLLMTRHMFQFALDIIDKTIARAEELEAFELIDDLLFLKIRCMTNTNTGHAIEDDVMLVESCRTNQEKHLQMVELTGLFVKAQQLAFTQNLSGFKKLMAHSLLQQAPEKLKSLRAQGMWFSIWQYCYTDKKELDRLSKREYALYKKRPEIKQIAPIAYVNNMHSMWDAAPANKGLAILEEMEQVVTTENLSLTAQQKSWNLFLISLRKAVTYRALEKFNEGIALCETLYKQAATMGEYFLVSLLYEHGLMLLCNKRTDEAADKIKELLNLNTTMRPELQTNARLLNIVINLELENYAIINALVRSTKLWLKKAKAGNSETDLLLKHAGAIARMPTNRVAIYRQLNSDVKAGRLKNTEAAIQLGRWVNRILAR